MRRLAVLVLLLFGVACAPEGRVRVLPPDELPSDLYSSPSPTPTVAPTVPVPVFFVRGEQLVEAQREAPEADGTAALVEFALRALLDGPTPQEQAEGILTTVPEGAELLRVELEGDVAEINLSKEFETGADEPTLLQRLAQVVYTATAPGRVRGVMFLIDGEPTAVIGGDGSPHEIVGRQDYASLAPGAGSPSPAPAPDEGA